MKLLSFAAVLTTTCLLSFNTFSGGDLLIEIDGFRNNNGFVLVSVFNSAEGFPSASEKAVIREKAVVQDGKCLLNLRALPEGTYAISVLHDENKNLKMDTRLLILPKEGFGFSQNTPVTFGPPGFRKASFNHTGQQQHIVINMRYF